jgi:hypothetical protein
VDSIDLNNGEKYKICAGKDCKNISKAQLKIKYINKTGHFCESCTEYLLQNELAITSDDSAL